MYLYGASGHAKVIIDILSSQGIKINALIDDNQNIKELLGYRVIHKLPLSGDMIISIGDNNIRKKISKKIGEYNFVIAVHPTAIISQNCVLGEGTVIMHGAIIQSSSIIGRHCIVNTGASIDHDCNIGDYVHVSPQATLCGNVTVGEGTWIGAGTTIIPGIKIGKWCVIGAGSVVINDIPDYAVIAGVPAKVFKYKKCNENIIGGG